MLLIQTAKEKAAVTRGKSEMTNFDHSNHSKTDISKRNITV